MDNVFGKNEFKNTVEVSASPEEFESFAEFVGPRLKGVAEHVDSIEDLEKTTIPEKVKEALVFAKKAVGKVMKFTFTRLLPMYMAYIGAGHFMQKEDGKFSERERAKKELEEKGITSEQASAYKLGVSDLLYRGINPQFGTEVVKDAVKDIPENLAFGRTQGDIEAPAREDAWLLYLGLPQKYGTFGISDHKPERSKDDKYYLKFNNFQNDFLQFVIEPYTGEMMTMASETELKLENYKYYFKKLNHEHEGDTSAILEHAREILPVKDFYGFVQFVNKGSEVIFGKEVLKYVTALEKDGGSRVEELILSTSKSILSDKDKDRETLYFLNDNKTKASDVMGHFTVSLGEDEKGKFISYYDNWDFDLPTEKSGKGFGRAFEIYDRIYYNPETGEIIDELLK